jgi:hypothetical protein
MTSTSPSQPGLSDQAARSEADDGTIRMIERAMAELQEMRALIRKERERAQQAPDSLPDSA